MASFEPLHTTTWINQSTISSELVDEQRDEFVVEFPSYDSSPIYLIDSDLKETVLSSGNYSIAAIELINDTEFGNLSSSSSNFDSLLLLLQGETVAGTLSILLAVFLYTLSLLTILGNAIVVYAILTERKLRTVSSTFYSTFSLYSFFFVFFPCFSLVFCFC